VVLMLPLSLVMDDSNFDCGGGGGGGGGPVAVAAAAVVAVDDKDRWRWCLMAAAAFNRGHATTSRCSKRVAQQENKRVEQREATQQQANLLPRRHFDMQRCHLSLCHGVTWHPCLPPRHGNMQHLHPPCWWSEG
jgi:hypothetical protein